MLAPNKPTIRSYQRISLTEIDAIVGARLGPGRVRGNRQPAAFSRQMAMYLANQVAGWSATQIGKFYNGRDHSTVCYAIGRVRVLRQIDLGVDGILASLTEEIGGRAETNGSGPRQNACAYGKAAASLLDNAVLEALAERIASRVLNRLISRAVSSPATAPEFQPE